MSFSTRAMRPDDWKELEFFKPSEFPAPEKMGVEFMQWLDVLRKAANVPMVITSSYRSPEYNRTVGGATNSAHSDVPCNAVDIGERPRQSDPNWNYTRWRIIKAAITLGCTRIGMYQNGSVHIDRSEDKRPGDRIWRVVGAI